MSQASLLVEIARVETELFHTPAGEPYALMGLKGPREAWPLRSREFRDWLKRRFYHPGNEVPRAHALQDALNVLESLARDEGPEHAVFLRKAEQAGALYLDLANASGQVVRITSDGWQLLPRAPVRFRRVRGMLPLPAPVRGGALDELRPFLNTASEGDFQLLVAWLLAALGPHQPYPLLGLHGEPGSARSRTARVLCRLADPQPALMRHGRWRPEELLLTAEHRLIIGLENLRGLSDRLSDALYCLSTGSAFARPQGFSGDAAAGFQAMRPVLWTSLGEIATDPDLIARTLSLRLPVIPEARSQTDAEFWPALETACPRILGALLDGVAAGLRHLPATRAPHLPRLADFARWGSAVETGLGWEAGSFPAACRKNRGEANGVALEAFPLAEPILALVEAEGEWAGLCKELLARLTERAGASPRAREGMAGDAGRAVARAAAGGAAPAGGRRGGDVPGAHPIGTAGAPVAVRARGPGGAGGP